MLGAILAESSPPPYKEMTDKSDEPAPKKLPYFGDGGEVEFGQPKEGEDAEGEEEEKMAEEFGLRFAKWWPFRLLKTLNLLLLLALLGLCVYNAVDYNRMGSFHWSKVWDDSARFLLKYYDPFRLVTGLAILFLMAIGAKSVHSRRSNSTGLAVMDICFALIIIVNLLYIGGFFGLRSYVEYRWFAPRLRKLHGTEDLVELAEWTPPHVYSSYGVHHYYAPNPRNNMTTTPTTTTTTTLAAPTDRDWQMMKQRVDAIRTRLLLDPAIAILSLLAILVNASLAFAIWGSMKRSRLYANYTNAIGSRREESPPPADEANANGELEQQAMASALDFARFWPIGFVKLLLTSITTVLCFLSIYGEIVPWQSRPFYHFFYGALGSACLANLVLYVQKVLLLFGGKKQQQKVGELNNFRKMDCLFNCVGALAFLSALMFDRWPEEFKYIYGLLIALFLVGPVRNLYLYKLGSQNCGGFKTLCGKDFELNMPLISIQVQINTGKCEKKKKKEEEEEKDDGKVDGEEKIEQ